MVTNNQLNSKNNQLNSIYKIKLFVCIGILLICVLSIFMTSCGRKDTSKDLNYFGGTGEIKSSGFESGFGMLYDDENIYFRSLNSVGFMQSVCYEFTKDHQIYAVCDIASCDHTDPKCKAHLEFFGGYFIFNHTLYKYENDIITECESEKVVYINQRPKEVTSEEAATDIIYLSVIDDEYIVIESTKFVYLVNKDFDIEYIRTDRGSSSWGKIYHNQYYYVSELDRLMSVDLTTKEAKEVNIDIEVHGIGNDESEDKLIISSGRELYKYFLDTNECIPIYDGLAYAMVNIIDGYTYIQHTDLPDSEKYIIDSEGNFVRDCTDCIMMGMDRTCKINGKIYAAFLDVTNDSDSGLTVERLGIAVMNIDGTGYEEYYMEGYQRVI